MKSWKHTLLLIGCNAEVKIQLERVKPEEVTY